MSPNHRQNKHSECSCKLLLSSIKSLGSVLQVDEDAGDLAKSITVDLNSIFEDFRFESVEELGLAGAQKLSSVRL